MAIDDKMKKTVLEFSSKPTYVQLQCTVTSLSRIGWLYIIFMSENVSMYTVQKVCCEQDIAVACNMLVFAVRIQH